VERLQIFEVRQKWNVEMHTIHHHHHHQQHHHHHEDKVDAIIPFNILLRGGGKF
jgi:hypothetical protein